MILKKNLNLSDFAASREITLLAETPRRKESKLIIFEIIVMQGAGN